MTATVPRVLATVKLSRSRSLSMEPTLMVVLLHRLPYSFLGSAAFFFVCLFVDDALVSRACAT